jgi:predicted RNA-binding protein with PUA-like domain
MATFLFKTEPGDYSFTDLQRDKQCVWSGVANPQARIHLRSIVAGDFAFIYHTGDVKAIVGLARVTRGAFEDPAQKGLNERGEIKAPVVTIEPVAPARNPVTLAAIKADPCFADFALVSHSRLSVMPVAAALDVILRKLGRF